MKPRALACLMMLLIACGKGKKEPPAATPAKVDGEATMTKYCVSCHVPEAAAKPVEKAKIDTAMPPDITKFVVKHATAANHAPPIEKIRALPPGVIVAALERGAMRTIGDTMKPEERVAVAEFLSGKKYVPQEIVGGYCAPDAGAKDNYDAPRWVGAGNGETLQRFQPSAGKLSRDTVSKLKLRWAYALPEGRQGSPLETFGSRLFFGDTAGRVHSLDQKTGCVHWLRTGERWIRTALNITKIGDRYIGSYGPELEPHQYYGFDVLTGKELWKTKVVDERLGLSSASPTVHDGTLYIPISVGTQNHFSYNEDYTCCTARGSVAAVDLATGKLKWRTYMTPEPKEIGKTPDGKPLMGPSGASVWKPPTIDAKLKRIYVATGEFHSPPQTETAAAIVALDMESGKIVWARPLAAEAVLNATCYAPWMGKCPWYNGPVTADATNGMLSELPNGKRVLLAANKNGKVWALDPDKDGAIVWEKQVGTGGADGGVQWPMAADAENVYVSIHDRRRWPKLTPAEWKAKAAKKESQAWILDNEAGALVALRLADGKEVWRSTGGKDACKDKPKACAKAFSSPPTVIPGVVFATSHDGFVRAFATSNGELLWEFDTAREFDTVQGVKANGGGIDGPGGVIVSGDMVFLTSGYSAHDVMPGNVLLAFSLD